MTPPDQAPETPPVVAEPPARPDYVLDKFASVEQQAQAYVELEKQLGKGGDTEPPVVDPETPPVVDPTGNTDLTIPKMPEVDLYETYREKYIAQQGTLTEADVAEFSKLSGVPATHVQAYMAGLQAQTQQSAQMVFGAVGGEAEYRAAMQWATANLSEAEITAYDKVVGSGDISMTTMAAKGLYAQYVAANGSNPSLVSGGPSNSNSAGYAEQGEMLRDMKSDKYKEDPAFRAEVERKVANSTSW